MARLMLHGEEVDIDETQLVCTGDFCGCAEEQYACTCEAVDRAAVTTTCRDCGEDMHRIEVNSGDPVEIAA